MKKESKVEFLRKWGITEPTLLRAGFSWLRYKNPPEKGIYWYYFSRWVRQRDVDIWGTCISCGKPITFDTCDAGHFMPAASCGRDLLFDPKNVNAECSRCNAFDETHLLGYAEGLDIRYGVGTADRLRQQRNQYLETRTTVRDWKADVYADKIRELPTYQQAMRDMENNVV